MFRGIVAEVHIPLFLGSVKIDPFKHNDLSSRQIEWLQSEPEHTESYLLRIPLIVITSSGIMISDSGHRDHPP